LKGVFRLDRIRECDRVTGKGVISVHCNSVTGNNVQSVGRQLCAIFMLLATRKPRKWWRLSCTSDCSKFQAQMTHFQSKHIVHTPKNNIKSRFQITKHKILSIKKLCYRKEDSASVMLS